MTQWKVVPLSSGQLLDVRPEDVLRGGDFRLCDTYRSGGGYDQFPAIWERRSGEPGRARQFVVQLYGCPLDCPYCYVTREGVWGEPKLYSSRDLVEAFVESGAAVFHLMGGAPALYMQHWPELLSELDQLPHKNWVFHSDLLLTEQVYPHALLKRIVHPRALYAVDVKGLTEEEHRQNTRKPFLSYRLWTNLGGLLFWRVPFYCTFTNIADEHVRDFWKECDRHFQFDIANLETIRQDSFAIRLVDYEAVRYTDATSWGKQL